MTNEDILRWLERIADVLHENAAYLTLLDSAIGDADHGINMDRGFKAVREKLPAMANMDIGSILKTVGTTLVSQDEALRLPDVATPSLSRTRQRLPVAE